MTRVEAGVPRLCVNAFKLRPGQQGWVNVTDRFPDGFRKSGEDCLTIAQRVPEPLTALYERRHQPPSPLPGGFNRAFYRWSGNVTKKDLDETPFRLRGASCGHCTYTTTYKILNGRLYRAPDPNTHNHLLFYSESSIHTDMVIHRKRAEDMLLTVLYLWDIPDVDFKLHFGDGCPDNNTPAFSWNVCRHKPKGGFTMPSTTAWLAALGATQTQVYHACLADRYPGPEGRWPLAYWRGTNTDNVVVDNFTIDNYRLSPRIRLHMDFKPKETTRIDAQLSALIFATGEVAMKVGAIAARVRAEDFNKAAVVIDMDGNGWSDRWCKLVHYNTFMLKQASNNTAFFEHLTSPGPLAFFRNDLSDLQEAVHHTMEAWDWAPHRLMSRAAHLQLFAAALMNHVAVAEAMAHALQLYKSKCTWQTVFEPNYNEVPFSQACQMGGSWPAEFCRRLQQYQPSQQPSKNENA